ncbi:MAG: SpoIIE family protein phosphatase, partial [Cytophagales bacterium]|nr:SpoIIE family protein phosphatase [Cytophagales bacterium]
RLLAQYQMMEMTTQQLSEVIFKLELEREDNLNKTEELRANNQALSESLNIIATQRKQITESISYAARIQRALISHEHTLRALLPHSFLLHMPKDTISGDFAYVTQKRHLIYLAVGDCTGHGVPAGMLTVVSLMLLSRLIEDADTQIEPSHIIHTLDFLFNERMQNSESNLRDGLELGFCIIDTKNQVIQYSGANLSLYDVKNGELTEYKGSKDTVGWCLRGYLDKTFETHTIPFTKGDTRCFYLATDGFADQCNSENKKLMTKNFKKILANICCMPIAEQGDILRHLFNEWKGTARQVDDVLVAGFQL